MQVLDRGVEKAVRKWLSKVAMAGKAAGPPRRATAQHPGKHAKRRCHSNSCLVVDKDSCICPDHQQQTGTPAEGQSRGQLAAVAIKGRAYRVSVAPQSTMRAIRPLADAASFMTMLARLVLTSLSALCTCSPVPELQD